MMWCSLTILIHSIPLTGQKETHEAGWTNQELQSYSTSQVKVGKDEGKTVLILTAKRTGNKVVSGRVNTKNKKYFKYGKVEASIKLPETANGLWPAFWMMGNNKQEWPACGEIDIMEMGDAQGIANGTSTTRVNTALHYGPDVAGHEQQYFAGDAGFKFAKTANITHIRLLGMKIRLMFL